MLNIFFTHPKFSFNNDIYKISIFNSFPNSSINNIMDYCDKRKPTNLLIIYRITKIIVMLVYILSFRVFRLLSSSLLLFPQHFSRYILWPSSGVCCLNF